MIKALVVALCCMVFPSVASAGIVDLQLSQAATSIVGHPVTTECETVESMPGVGGFVNGFYITVDGVTSIQLEDVIHERGDMCGFYRLALNNANWTKRQRKFANSDTGVYGIAQAILILRHEATHIRDQQYDEGIVECNNFRNVWQDIHAMGFDHKLERKVWLQAVELHSNQDDLYLTVC